MTEGIGRGWWGPPKGDHTRKLRLNDKGKTLFNKVSKNIASNKMLFVPKFNTTREAAQWIRNNNIAKDVKLTGVNLDMLNVALQRLDELKSEFKTSFVLDKLYFSKRASSAASAKALRLGYEFGKDPNMEFEQKWAKDIWISQREFKQNQLNRAEEARKLINDPNTPQHIKASRERMAKNFEKASKFDVFTVLGDRIDITDHVRENAKETVTHEFGHMIEEVIIGSLNTHRTEAELKPYGEIKETLVSMWHRTDLPENDVTKISEYASKTIHEYFAESLVQFFHCKSKPLPKNMESFIKLLLNREEYKKSVKRTFDTVKEKTIPVWKVDPETGLWVAGVKKI